MNQDELTAEIARAFVREGYNPATSVKTAKIALGVVLPVIEARERKLCALIIDAYRLGVSVEHPELASAAEIILEEVIRTATSGEQCPPSAT